MDEIQRIRIRDEILAQADRLESGYEWVQSDPHQSRSACAVMWYDSRGQQVLSHVARHVINMFAEKTHGHSVIIWNDKKAKSVGEVIDLLKLTAKELSNEQS